MDLQLAREEADKERSKSIFILFVIIELVLSYYRF
jgi:hypothetical protein